MGSPLSAQVPQTCLRLPCGSLAKKALTKGRNSRCQHASVSYGVNTVTFIFELFEIDSSHEMVGGGLHTVPSHEPTRRPENEVWIIFRSHAGPAVLSHLS
jgi:hypothetical protein